MQPLGCALGRRGASAAGACARRTLGLKDAIAPARAAHAGSRDAAGARPRAPLGALARVGRVYGRCARICIQTGAPRPYCADWHYMKLWLWAAALPVLDESARGWEAVAVGPNLGPSSFAAWGDPTTRLSPFGVSIGSACGMVRRTAGLRGV
jgi:hypothetical protein